MHRSLLLEQYSNINVELLIKVHTQRFQQHTNMKSFYLLLAQIWAKLSPYERPLVLRGDVSYDLTRFRLHKSSTISVY